MDKTKKGRTTVYNEITSEEKLKQVNKENTELEKDYLEYLASVGRSESTIKQYRSNLHIFWCWNLDYNGNKFFVKMTKREFSKFQSHALKEWGWSPRRVRTFKATLSSLSNYIENILDDEFEGYKPIVNKIESPADKPIREKTVLTNEDIQPVLGKLLLQSKNEMACFLALALYSGRRKAELTRFKVSYFTSENLICGGALYKTPEKMRTKGHGEGGKLLDVYVLAKQFQPYLDIWLDERKKRKIKSDWLFPKCVDGKWKDEPIPVSQIDSWSRTISKMLNKPFYPHAMRHTFTTNLLEQNLPESVVQTIIGWSSGDMVKLYDDRTADATLEKYFGEDGIKQVERKELKDL